jgi:hypothetical protein
MVCPFLPTTVVGFLLGGMETGCTGGTMAPVIVGASLAVSAFDEDATARPGCSTTAELMASKPSAFRNMGLILIIFKKTGAILRPYNSHVAGKNQPLLN